MVMLKFSVTVYGKNKQTNKKNHYKLTHDATWIRRLSWNYCI